MRKKDSALPSLKTGSHDVQRPGVAMAATRKCYIPKDGPSPSPQETGAVARMHRPCLATGFP